MNCLVIQQSPFRMNNSFFLCPILPLTHSLSIFLSLSCHLLLSITLSALSKCWGPLFSLVSCFVFLRFCSTFRTFIPIKTLFDILLFEFLHYRTMLGKYSFPFLPKLDQTIIGYSLKHRVYRSHFVGRYCEEKMAIRKGKKQYVLQPEIYKDSFLIFASFPFHGQRKGM